MKQKDIIPFQNSLLDWYDQHARSLPWREDPSPYRVWISEVMLQQTRVETVKPYFKRFLKEVPSISDLAKIPENELLKLWQGLGYYSRAKNLKKSAQIILEQYEGKLPWDLKSLQTLPGIGPYTAGAISSIAFGQRTVAIDGNVIRVITRITADSRNVNEPKVQRDITHAVNALLPKERVGDFNQALMELGATTCLPKGAPKCFECPINPICQGHQQDIAKGLPVKPKKKRRRIEKKTVFIIRASDSIAIRQRPQEGLLSSLWEFPHVEGHLAQEDCPILFENWGIDPYKITAIESSKHIFSHLEWHMIGYFISVKQMPRDGEFHFATPQEIKEEYSIPSAFKVYLDFIETLL